MAGLDEEIFESASGNDDKCSLIEEGYWYENDLLLAAELGKTLLERNRDLETKLTVEAKTSMTLRMEIDLLKKQLETLRELNKNKMMLYEDVDRNSQDLEMNNRSLDAEIKKLKERVKNIGTKNSHLERLLEETQREQLVLQRERDQRVRRQKWERQEQQQHEKELQICEEEMADDGEQPLFCSGCQRLERAVAATEAELESQAVETVELHATVEAQDRRLHLLLAELEDLGWAADRQQHQQRHEMVPDARRQSTKTKSNSIEDDLYNCLEYDIDKVDGKPIKVGHLQSGGQVLSSETSLRIMGAQIPPASPLTELDVKYHGLVRQYEQLIEASANTAISATEPEPGSTNNNESYKLEDDSGQMQFREKLDNIFSEETRRQRKLLTTQNYRPKYKQLFRDAFDLLSDMKQSKPTSSAAVANPVFDRATSSSTS